MTDKFYDKITQTCTFGEHLMIDGYFGDRDRLSDRDIVTGCLKELPQLLSMRPLADPRVYWATPNNIKDCGGWTGIVPIHESHISTHTFSNRGFVSADVYTCTEGIDQELVVAYFTNAFGLKETEVQFVKRGTKYPLTDIYPISLPRTQG